MKLAHLALALALLLPSTAIAVSTLSFLIDTDEAFSKGEFEGTASLSSGELSRSVATERISLEGPPVAYTSAVGPDGAIYVGTGNEGTIYRVTDNGAKPFSMTHTALVASLLWVGDTLYAGTLPHGTIFTVNRKGEAKKWVTLEGAEHVWALAAGKKGQLFAATGPQGKLFAIDGQGRTKVLHDDDAEHLLCLGQDDRGRLYVGTSNGARLVRIAQGRSEVLYDATGDEITALDVGASFVAIAANEFPAPPPPSKGSTSNGAGKTAKKGPKPGKGTAYAIAFDGAVRELYQSKKAHISAIEVSAGDGAVELGLAEQGRVVRVEPSGETSIWADADERQVVHLSLRGASPHFLTSDGVAVYRVLGPHKTGTWTSEVLDAKVHARFGQLSFRTRGQVRFATRSGNTEKPDASWSSWSSELTKPGPIRSAPARFLQVRAVLTGDAQVYAVEAFYLPQNLPARVKNIRVERNSKGEKDAKGNDSADLKVTWDTDNPDKDELRFRLFVRAESGRSSLPLLREHEQLTKAEYTWNTGNLPDGFYRLTVQASDEGENPPALAHKSEASSAPILVDNRPPEISGLRLQGSQLRGSARDQMGPVRALALSLDGGDYIPVAPEDGLLDTAVETFSVDLGKLSPGTHVLTVKATDAANNVGTEAFETDVKD